MSDREIEICYLTRDEAVRYIKRNYHRGISYRVCTRSFVYTTAPTEVLEGRNPRGYELYACVAVSQKQAVDFVHDLISGLFAEKHVKVEVRYHKPGVSDITGRVNPGMMFIG